MFRNKSQINDYKKENGLEWGHNVSVYLYFIWGVETGIYSLIRREQLAHGKKKTLRESARERERERDRKIVL